ncbi:transglutaminase family protein [Phreatobacter stygius]|nr:transglutaminase family protein [Phreatobacter stygius]
MDIRIRHKTTYQYGSGVAFGPHRLMLRPRDSFDLRILDTRLDIWPAAQVEWIHDVYGNPVAIATFREPGDRLEITSELILRRYGSTLPRNHASARGAQFAPRYSDDERIVLQPFLAPASSDGASVLTDWMHQVLADQTPGDDPIARLLNAINANFAYALRYEEGVQAPAMTLALRTGSCRDLAWLFIEAVRRLGYAARFVSGYLHDGLSQDTALRAPTSLTHAWAELFIPGDGWVEFDPTNALVADPHLIRVAMARVPWEASPVSGSFVGPAGALTGLFVGVDIVGLPEDGPTERTRAA